MILAALIKFIKNVVDGFSAVCAFLLIRLKLWVSAVFAFLFIMICAFSGTQLKGKTINFFVGGIIACFLIAVVWNVLIHYKRMGAKPPQNYSNVSGVKVKDSESGMYSDNFYSSYKRETDEKIQQLPPQTDNKRYSYSTYSQIDDTGSKIQRLSELSKSERKYDDFADLKKKYFEQNREQETQSVPNVSKQTEQTAELKYEPLQQTQRASYTDEKPRIFAMRQDPDVLIYEFSDRLEFYRKTKRGLIPERVEFKN